MDESSSRLSGRIDGNGRVASVGPGRAGRFFAVRGFLSGVAGGVCCFAGAVASGLGVGGVSFFGMLMDRFQPLFLVASLLLMGFWVRRTARGTALAGVGVRGVLGVAGRPVLAMGVTWSVTLVVAMVAARLAGLG